MIRAQEGERAQLGQELHDNVNQVLTTVKLYNEMMLDGIGDSRDILNKSIRQLQNCINEIRSISKRLSAPSLGRISLADSILELVESINLTNRIDISSRIEGLDDRVIPQDLHLAIYRINQEQLNNILKYAEARHAWITNVNNEAGLVLTIADDGRGFDMGQGLFSGDSVTVVFSPTLERYFSNTRSDNQEEMIPISMPTQTSVTKCCER